MGATKILEPAGIIFDSDSFPAGGAFSSGVVVVGCEACPSGAACVDGCDCWAVAIADASNTPPIQRTALRNICTSEAAHLRPIAGKVNLFRRFRVLADRC